MIKIYSLAILLSLSTVFAQAQFVTGQRVLGGNIGFSTNKRENISNGISTTNSTAFLLSPSLGSFTKPNVLRGVGLSYGYSIQKSEYSLNNSTQRIPNHLIGINLFSQRFFSLSEKIFFTTNTGGAVTYSFGKNINKNNNNVNETKSSGYGIAINFAPGLSYRLTQRLLFDAYLSNLINVRYSHTETKYNNPPNMDTRSTHNNFSISSSLSNTSLGNVGLGFRWLLKK
ncbi:MAG TPA: hypothetical protein VF622_16315 [Segetibacter sp.]|jgi:hypothetical protein